MGTLKESAIETGKAIAKFAPCAVLVVAGVCFISYLRDDKFWQWLTSEDRTPKRGKRKW